MEFFAKKDKDKAIRILSIEDSRLIQEILEFEIRYMGYEFVSAFDGEEGVKTAEKEQPDLILLDNQMPGISGLATCLRLKQNRKTAHIPVIMCTGESLMDTVEKAIKNGAAGYINKPINVEQLKMKIAQVLKIKVPAGARQAAPGTVKENETSPGAPAPPPLPPFPPLPQPNEPPAPPPVEVMVPNTESPPLVSAAPPVPTTTVSGTPGVTASVPVLNPPAPPPPPT